jgi:hypothetical protein
MGVCHDACDPPCSYGCALRQKGVTVAPSALPSQMNSVPPRTANPAWERGIVTEKRPGGHVVPVLDSRLKPIRVKQYAQKRREIDAGLRSIKNPT